MGVCKMGLEWLLNYLVTKSKDDVLHPHEL